MGRRELLRIKAKLKIEYKSFDQFYKEYTKDISKGGLFIKTDKILNSQDVVEISLYLPDQDEPIKMVGEIVHVIEPELADAHGWEGGMGVHFVDFEKGAHQQIEDYITRHYKEEPSMRVPDRRAHPRVSIRLRVKFPSLEVLQQDYSNDISRGGIFIQTQKPRAVGDRFVITMVHPVSGEELEFNGEVVRVTREDAKAPGSVSGMGIRFLELDEEKRKSIDKFLGINKP
jgi:type IV pilus assembly protein PilZ